MSTPDGSICVCHFWDLETFGFKESYLFTKWVRHQTHCPVLVKYFFLYHETNPVLQNLLLPYSCFSAPESLLPESFLLFIHLFVNCLLCSHYMPGTVLNTLYISCPYSKPRRWDLLLTLCNGGGKGGTERPSDFRSPFPSQGLCTCFPLCPAGLLSCHLVVKWCANGLEATKELSRPCF